MIFPPALKFGVLAAVAAGLCAWSWSAGGGRVQARWDAEKARQAAVIATQAVSVATITAAQSSATHEADSRVQDRINAVHRFYADRVRQQPAVRPSAVLIAADSAGYPSPAAADAGYSAPAGHDPELDGLKERCAVTTEIARGWQEWWDGIERAQGVAP